MKERIVLNTHGNRRCLSCKEPIKRGEEMLWGGLRLGTGGVHLRCGPTNLERIFLDCVRAERAAMK